MDRCSYCTYTGNWELCSTKGAYCKKDDWIVRYLLQQLSEAREEVERLKSQPTGYYDNTKDVEQARQEAAREILAILRADRWAESELAGIKAKFGLEGVRDE